MAFWLGKGQDFKFYLVNLFSRAMPTCHEIIVLFVHLVLFIAVGLNDHIHLVTHMAFEHKFPAFVVK